MLSKNKLLNVILLVLSGLLAVVKALGEMETPDGTKDTGDSWDMY